MNRSTTVRRLLVALAAMATITMLSAGAANAASGPPQPASTVHHLSESGGTPLPSGTGGPYPAAGVVGRHLEPEPGKG